MRHSISIKIPFFLIFIICCTTSILKAQDSSAKKEKIKTLLKKEITAFPKNTQVSIAIVNGDKTDYLGVLKAKDSVQFVENKTSVFEIGSVTKVFTATLLAELVENKTVALDDKVLNLLPFSLEKPTENQQKITLQMLSNHTSGLPRLPANIASLLTQNPFDPYANYGEEKLKEYLKTDFKPISNPGEKSAYSNLGAGLLGYLLSLKSGESYEDLLQKEIFSPLGMASSTTQLNKVPINNLVKGINTDGSEVSNWNFKALSGAGAIKSNVIDLDKFVRMHMLNNDLAYNLTQKVTHVENKQVALGLGWHIINKDNSQLLFHNGQTGGYTSCVIINKKTQKAIIMLTNISAFNPQSRTIDGLCFQILNQMI